MPLAVVVPVAFVVMGAVSGALCRYRLTVSVVFGAQIPLQVTGILAPAVAVAGTPVSVALVHVVVTVNVLLIARGVLELFSPKSRSS